MKKNARALILSLLFTSSVISYHAFAQSGRLWATYYGGSNVEFGFSTATDGSGNVYMAGTTFSASGIASGGFQNTFGGGSQDAFLVKFDAAGNRLWATYYGDTGDDICYGVATDAAGNVYITGITNSTSNIASGGFQNVFGGGSNDAFLVKFDAASGNRLWATYYGGTGYDLGNSVSADAAGNVYLAGWTGSSAGISSGGFQNTFGGGTGDAFLVKFDAVTGNRTWATYDGGSGDDRGFCVAVDATGNIYLSGGTGSSTGIASGGFQNTYGGGAYDAFLTKVNAAGSLLWATYYGGSGTEFYYGTVAADAAGNVYLSGITGSAAGIASGGFQNTYGGGLYDAFLVKFDAASGNRIWATYYGGSGLDEFYSIAIDASNNLYLAGWSASTSGISAGGFQNTNNGGTYDAMLVKFDPLGNRMCATYYGGTGMEQGTAVALDGVGNVYVSGETDSPTSISSGGFQNVYGGGTYDAFLVKFSSCFTVLNLSTSSTSTSCFGTCDGTTTVTPIGGTAPYTYTWNSSPVQTTAIATGLCAGTYTVVVTDTLGNTATATATVTQPLPVSAVFSTVLNTSCPTSCDGSATAAGTGGTAPYTYSWSNAQTTVNATGLCAGTYTLNVTDANGCSQTQTVTITSPAPIVLSFTTTNANCTAANGTATVNATGGTPGYTYLWNNSQTGQTATGLISGSYNVVVTDANGCTSFTGVIVGAVNTLSATVSSTPSSCSDSTGTATATPVGGTAPYSYSWSDGQFFPIATGLSPGLYVVTVMDINGCSITLPVNVGMSAGPTATASITGTTSSGTQLNATGGGYYFWTPSAGLSCVTCSDPIASPGVSTVYCVQVTDVGGCTDVACITVDADPCNAQFLSTLLPNAFSPNGDGGNDVFCVPANTCVLSFVLTVYDRWGEKVFETSDIKNCWDGTFGGKTLNTDVFVYSFSAELSNGESFKQKGNISLVK